VGKKREEQPGPEAFPSFPLLLRKNSGGEDERGRRLLPFFQGATRNKGMRKMIEKGGLPLFFFFSPLAEWQLEASKDGGYERGRAFMHLLFLLSLFFPQYPAS